MVSEAEDASSNECLRRRNRESGRRHGNHGDRKTPVPKTRQPARRVTNGSFKYSYFPPPSPLCVCVCVCVCHGCEYDSDLM